MTDDKRMNALSYALLRCINMPAHDNFMKAMDKVLQDHKVCFLHPIQGESFSIDAHKAAEDWYCKNAKLATHSPIGPLVTAGTALDGFEAGAMWARGQLVPAIAAAKLDNIDQPAQKSTVSEDMTEEFAKIGRHISSVSHMLAGAINELTDAVQSGNAEILGLMRPEDKAINPDLTDIPCKRLNDLDELFKHTAADPNANEPYLRGLNNGIILAHATIFDHECQYIEAPEADKIEDERDNLDKINDVMMKEMYEAAATQQMNGMREQIMQMGDMLDALMKRR